MSAAAVAVAVGWDLIAGEPPLPLHPVAWMGRYLDHASRVVPGAPPVRAAVSGGTAWLLGASTTALAGILASRTARRLSAPAGVVLIGVTLSPLLSLRMLLDEVACVESALAVDLTAGRGTLSRIVSRDTASLTEAEVRAAAIESLAENLSDSFVAPLFWYAVGGLPAASVYRFANTADAMWGYLDERWEYPGKVSARADDVLNLVPARLTALLLRGAHPSRWRRLAQEARCTESRNAGWPMAAMALRLDLRLDKQDSYLLNASGHSPGPNDTGAALALARRAAATAVLLALLAARASTGGRATFVGRACRDHSPQPTGGTR